MPRGAFRLFRAASVKLCQLRKDVSEFVAEMTRKPILPIIKIAWWKPGLLGHGG